MLSVGYYKLKSFVQRRFYGMLDKKIILITDKNEKIEYADISNRNLEGNNTFSTLTISNAIKNIVKDFEIFTDTHLFLQNVENYKNDIIFPMKYGYNAPDSKSIIPGICEGANLKYVGADDYAHMICNDKYTAKLFSKEFGIKTAPSILFRKPMDLLSVKNQLSLLNPPFVIKPNFGGGSTGISEHNVCLNYEEAAQLIIKLYSFHNMPILAEEYIPGEEVEMILVGSKKEVIFSEEVQLIMDNKEYFDTEIWGYETKKIDDSSIDFKMSSFIPESDIQKIHSLFMSFEKIEFMRVDGRMYKGQFHLIELSPDCYLGDDCAFYYAFAHKGYTLSQMFEFLILNSLNHYQL
jgi:D-alanine-D-alanine ligase and related ATP-grasp enzymes